MNRAKRALVVLSAGLLASTAITAQAADWPQWRGTNRDGKAVAFSAPQTWPKSLTEKWKASVGSGDAAPALVDGQLYVFTRQGADEVTLCLDATTGKEIWKDTVAVPAITGPAARHPGPRSSPAVANGKVVTLGATGILTCLDASTGKVRWRNQDYKAVPKFYTSSSPLILDDLCIAQLGGPGAGTVIALDLATGTVKWKCDDEGPAYSSPVLLTVDGTKQLVALTEKNIVGIDASSGKLLWQLPFAQQDRNYNAATPIVDGQTVIYTGAGRGTKAIKVEKQDSGFAAKELWTNPQAAVQFCSPVLKDGLIYAISDKGNLFCISESTGQTLWTDPAKRGSYGAMVDAGSAILALNEKSELVAFKPDDKQFTELANIKVSTTPTYAYPVVVDKAVYIKDQDTLTMWTVE